MCVCVQFILKALKITVSPLNGEMTYHHVKKRGKSTQRSVSAPTELLYFISETTRLMS